MPRASKAVRPTAAKKQAPPAKAVKKAAAVVKKAATKAVAATKKTGTARKAAPAKATPVKKEQVRKATAAPKKQAPPAPVKKSPASASKKSQQKAPIAAPKKEAPAKVAATKKEVVQKKSAPVLDKFFEEQRALLLAERSDYERQAVALKAEADSLAQEMEPGDIQFDDESGEGGTTTVDRERDLALSAQALVAVDEIDHALVKTNNGTYGICESCGRLIPKPRLEALPFARLCIDCKSGGLSRR